MENPVESKVSRPLWKMWWFWVFMAVVVFGLIVINRPKTTSDTLTEVTTQANPSPINDVQQIQGTYMDYNYTILYQQGESKYVATFQPFLPRNDDIVTGAMLEAINRAYGNNTVKNLAPEVVTRNGTSLIMIEGVNKNYYFLLVKEDTGEINSMNFWSE